MERQRLRGESIDRQGPCITVKARDAKMAEDDRIVGTRDAIPRLVRGQRDAAEKTLRVKFGARQRMAPDADWDSLAQCLGASHRKAGKLCCKNPYASVTIR